MVLQEALEICRNAHHATIKGVNARLNGALVLRCDIAAHFRSRRLDLLLVYLDLGQRVLDANVELRHLVLLRCEQ